MTGFSDAQLLERFVAGHDAGAFEALVARHGPMVLSVCRGILKDPNDAEDAFQATFLILVKKSGCFRGRVALGPWLYRVAHRVAIRANAAAARRRACERRAGQMVAATAMSEPACPDEPLQALHEEIARLPEALRRAIILCDLQRVPQTRAAAELRLSERTLQRRLSQGRERLKARLIRRGLAQEFGMLGAAFLRQAREVVPPAWGEATVRAAMATVDQSLFVGAGSVAAQELTREVLRIMLLQKLTSASFALLAAGLLAWGASAALVGLGKEPAQKTAASPDPTGRNAEAAGTFLVRGRVLGPDGQAVPGAKLYLTVAHGFRREPFPAAESATAGADGRFELSVPRAKSDEDTALVAAMAANLGVGWVGVPTDGRSDDLTLRLVRDQAITGEILDFQGRPVPGATLRVLDIGADLGEDLGSWLELAPGDENKAPRLERADYAWDGINVSRLALEVMTDAEGRFRLDGLGRNRIVRLEARLTRHRQRVSACPHAARRAHQGDVQEGPARHLLRGQIPVRGRAIQAGRRRGPRQGDRETIGGHNGRE